MLVDLAEPQCCRLKSGMPAPLPQRIIGSEDKIMTAPATRLTCFTDVPYCSRPLKTEPRHREAKEQLPALGHRMVACVCVCACECLCVCDKAHGIGPGTEFREHFLSTALYPGRCLTWPFLLHFTILLLMAISRLSLSSWRPGLALPMSELH